MSSKQMSLADAALQGCQLTRMPDICIIKFGRAGSAAVFNLELRNSIRWGNSRPSSGQPERDRQQFFEHLEHVLSQRDSFTSTRGSQPGLQGIWRELSAAGHSRFDWQLPRENAPEKPATAAPALAPSSGSRRRSVLPPAPKQELQALQAQFQRYRPAPAPACEYRPPERHEMKLRGPCAGKVVEVISGGGLSVEMSGDDLGF